MDQTVTDRQKIDLLNGSVIKKLILFFLPIAAGTVFQQLYNAVDALVVSRYVGTVALASVGGTPAIVTNLVIGFFVALTAGFAVIIAQYFGSNNIDRIKDAVKTSIVFSFILGLIAGVLIIIFTPQILTVLGTTEEAYEGSLIYQRIYFGGSILIILYNMGSCILRAVGDSRFPFLSLFVGCVINIALDFLFVLVFNMGVAGVAWATVIAEFVAASMVIIKLLTTSQCCRLKFKGTKFDNDILKSMIKIGLPSGLQSSVYGFSNLILQIGVNSLGTIVVASWAMSGKVDGIFWGITQAFGTAITTFVGQNYGAKNYDRIKKSSKQGFLFLFLLTICISCFLLGIGKPILGILTNDGDVIETTYTIMTYFVPFYFLWSIIETFTGILRGIGDTVIPSIIQAVGICIFRIIWVYTIFATYHTLLILSMSYLASWIVTDIAILIYYFVTTKKSLLNPNLLLEYVKD